MMFTYLIKEVVDLVYQQPSQIIIQGSQEIGIVPESVFYQELVPKMFYFFKNPESSFGLWIDRYLSERRFSPYYQKFCSDQMEGVPVKSVIYYTHLRRIFESLVLDEVELKKIQQRGLKIFLEGKSPYVGSCYHMWLTRHFLIYPD